MDSSILTTIRATACGSKSRGALKGKSFWKLKQQLTIFRDSMKRYPGLAIILRRTSDLKKITRSLRIFDNILRKIFRAQIDARFESSYSQLAIFEGFEKVFFFFFTINYSSLFLFLFRVIQLYTHILYIKSIVKNRNQHYNNKLEYKIGGSSFYFSNSIIINC
jgi:hypothetical protein